jgi:uncharacterized protein (TIGR03067 family)
MTYCASVIVLAVLLLSTALSAEIKDDAFDGTWLPSDAELAGTKFPDAVVKSIKLVIEGEKYTVTVGKETDRGIVKRDLKAKPMTRDIVGSEGPNKGKTILAICELKDDTLKVCYDLSGKARPTAFETKPDTQLFLVTYKRGKK